MKVLIPTSGLGARLGELTKYTNKALAKIGDKPVIARIIDLYPSADFVITLGYKGEHVREFLEMAYPERNFEFVYVDPYDGEGSGLLKSLSFAKDKLQCPFIFHVCDTILPDFKPKEVTSNWLGCAKSSRSDLFRTVSIRDGKVGLINEKGEMSYDYALIGVCGIFDYQAFWSVLLRMLDENIQDQSDCHVYREMLCGFDFYIEVFDKWYDTGSISNLNETRKNFNAEYTVLEKPSESIFFINGDVIKFFADPDIVAKRIERQKILHGITPSIISSGKYFYKYKSVNGVLLSKIISEERVPFLFLWAKNNLWKESVAPDENFRQSLFDFYITKTKNRAAQYLLQAGVKDTENIINGDVVPPLSVLLASISIDKLCVGERVVFHGDFIADNILFTDDGFSLLDWRQDFAGDLVYGDIYYDLAKFNHNLIFNHDIISSGNYKIESKNNAITCDVLRSHRLVRCQEKWIQLLESYGYDIKIVKILTSIIWLNMAPLHEYPINKLLFNFGKWNLWKELA